MRVDAISEETVRAAYAFYKAEPCRTLEQAATEYGVHNNTLWRLLAEIGLPSKTRQERAAGARAVAAPNREMRRAQARETSYTRVVALYRAEKSLAEIVEETGICLATVGELLRASDEACPRCEVLLRETEPYGVAVLASGERLCQWCGEVEPGGVARWEREPVEVVRDYYEIANVYAWEGER